MPPHERDDGGVTTSLRGRLLVATPVLQDPHFVRTVVLVLEHGDAGAVGVVLNRPSATPVGELLPGWSAVAAEPGVVFVGGPVAPDAAIGLAVATGGGEPAGWEPVGGWLGVVDLSAPPDPTLAARVFAGYAGWGEGQLEWEVGLDSWFVVDAGPDDLLTSRPEQLWRDVLRRQSGRLAWFADHPADVSSN